MKLCKLNDFILHQKHSRKKQNLHSCYSIMFNSMSQLNFSFYLMLKKLEIYKLRIGSEWRFLRYYTVSLPVSLVNEYNVWYIDYCTTTQLINTVLVYLMAHPVSTKLKFKQYRNFNFFLLFTYKNKKKIEL